MKRLFLIIYFSFSLNYLNGQTNNSLTSSEVKLFGAAYSEYSKNNYELSLKLSDSLINMDNELRDSPIHCRAIGLKGMVLKKLGDLNKAKQIFKEAIECDSQGYFWYKYLGQVYFSLNDFDSAEYTFNKIDPANPKDHEYFYNISLVKKAKGDYIEALDYMSRCVEECQPSYNTKTTCKDIFYLRAEVYHSLNKDSLAIYDIKRHLEIHSNDSMAISLKKEIIKCLNMDN